MSSGGMENTTHGLCPEIFELFGTGLLSLWTTSSSFSAMIPPWSDMHIRAGSPTGPKYALFYGIARNHESVGMLLIRLNI